MLPGTIAFRIRIRIGCCCWLFQQRLVSRTPSEMNDSISLSETSFASSAGWDDGNHAPENSQEDPFRMRAMQKTESKGM
jgi:hypothetical protein